MAEKLAKRLFQFTLQQNRQAADKLVTIPIHGPDISNDDVIDILSKLSVCQGPKILHLDVASQVNLSNAAITTILNSHSCTVFCYILISSLFIDNS